MTKFLSWAAVIAWMGLIFFFSHEPATESKQLSSGVTATILDVSGEIAPSLQVDNGLFHHLVRKSAHFTIYLGLGLLTFHVCWRSGLTGYRLLGLPFGICVLYAASDEFHQLFVPGRSGEVSDVLLDSTGATIGILLALGAYQLVKKRRRTRGRDMTS